MTNLSRLVRCTDARKHIPTAVADYALERSQNRLRTRKCFQWSVYMCAVISVVILICSCPVIVMAEETGEKKDFIKWVDFKVCYDALEQTMKYDIQSYGSDTHLKWIELLAYLGAKYGGDFSIYKEKDLTGLVNELQSGKKISELTENMKYYPYYHEAYTAVLGEFVGEYKIQVPKGGTAENTSGQIANHAPDLDDLEWEKKYGLKVFSPIAKDFGYDHYDDFGSGRTYGYKRRHLGHDLFGATGTPIIAVESGIVEVLGWNQYGGWRIGIRSFDGKRYYYYAHLRKDRPYHADMSEGKIVKAGDVIGYMGRTGYSSKENTNNIQQTHLHLGMQLIFDPSQKEGPKEIWVDLYELTMLLRKNKCDTYRVDETKEYYRKYDFYEPLLSEAEMVASNPLVPALMDEKHYFADNESGSIVNDAAVKGADTPPGKGLVIKEEQDERIEVPIVMYHRLSANDSLLGQYVISPQEFEDDLAYIKEQGYQTVTMSDLVAYVNDDGTLPEKPIVLTFDDGEYSVYRYAMPLLQKYDMKAVVSIIGKITDEYSEAKESAGRDDINYPNLTWAQVKEMQDTGLIEFQNHSYNLHGTKRNAFGAQKSRNESKEEYRRRLSEDLGSMQNRMDKMLGKTPDTFVYPFGAISHESVEVLQELGFSASLSCYDRINYVVPGQPECLYGMGRSLRPHGRTFAKVLMSAARATR